MPRALLIESNGPSQFFQNLKIFLAYIFNYNEKYQIKTLVCTFLLVNTSGKYCCVNITNWSNSTA